MAAVTVDTALLVSALNNYLSDLTNGHVKDSHDEIRNRILTMLARNLGTDVEKLVKEIVVRFATTTGYVPKPPPAKTPEKPNR